MVEKPDYFEIFLSTLRNNLPAAVVFGAGAQISARLRAKGISFEFYRGQRVTTPAMLELIEDEFNKTAEKIAGMLRSTKSVFVRGNEIFVCRRKSQRLGMVGEIISVKTESVKKSFSVAECVLVSPVGADINGALFNVNADVSAANLARALDAKKLIFCTKVGGVMDAENNLIKTIDRKRAQELIESGVISLGMIPKVLAALETIESRVQEVVIGETHITA